MARVEGSLRRIRAEGPPGGALAAELAPFDFEEFYRLMFMPLLRRACDFGLSNEDARDVVQDAFALAVTKLDFGRNPTGWMYAVVDRLCLNFQRTKTRRIELLARWAFYTKEDLEPNEAEGDDIPGGDGG